MLLELSLVRLQMITSAGAVLETLPDLLVHDVDLLAVAAKQLRATKLRESERRREEEEEEKGQTLKEGVRQSFCTVNP